MTIILMEWKMIKNIYNKFYNFLSLKIIEILLFF